MEINKSLNLEKSQSCLLYFKFYLQLALTRKGDCCLSSRNKDSERKLLENTKKRREMKGSLHISRLMTRNDNLLSCKSSR